jgi:hypothetical protein
LNALCVHTMYEGAAGCCAGQEGRYGAHRPGRLNRQAVNPSERNEADTTRGIRRPPRPHRRVTARVCTARDYTRLC